MCSNQSLATDESVELIVNPLVSGGGSLNTKHILSIPVNITLTENLSTS